MEQGQGNMLSGVHKRNLSKTKLVSIINLNHFFKCLCLTLVVKNPKTDRNKKIMRVYILLNTLGFCSCSFYNRMLHLHQVKSSRRYISTTDCCLCVCACCNGQLAEQIQIFNIAKASWIIIIIITIIINIYIALILEL